jgi:YVTN family beta-propeller protein
VGAFLAVLNLPVLAATFAYITNQRDNNASVINTANNTVVATVAVGCQPVGAAVTPARAHVADIRFADHDDGDFVFVPG